MRTRLALLTCLAAVLVVACSSGGGKHAKPPFRLSITAPALVHEREPATFTIAAVDTAGNPTEYSGTIDVAANGPVSPVTIPITGGTATADLTFTLGGDAQVTFSSGTLVAAQSFFVVRPPVPARVTGPATDGSVLAEGSGWDSAGAWSPSTVVSGSAIRLYYASSAATPVSGNIGLAVSTDGGLTFFKTGAPVVGPGAAAAACHVSGASNPEVFGATGAWTMLYEGRGAGGTHLCRATSTDGMTWTPSAGAGADGSVLDKNAAADAIDNVAVRSASVVDHGAGNLELLYGAEGQGEFDANNPGPDQIGALGNATSTDGLAWTKHPGSFTGGACQFGVMTFPDDNDWQTYAVADPAVETNGTVYYVWASGLGTGFTWRIGQFSSTSLTALGPHVDGSDTQGAVIDVGAAGSFDDAGALQPALVSRPSDGTHLLFYTGIKNGDTHRRIGVVTY